MTRQRDARGWRRLRPAALGTTTLCVASAVGFSATAQDRADAQAPDTGSVVVTGHRPGIAALSETIQNTAQSINVVPQEVLHQQGVTTLQDSLKNVPGITLNAGEGGSHGDTINLRGFPASDDFFLDGLRDTGFYTRDSFDVEQVEVYKGPASTLFGRGSTGGVVNQVSKTPVLRPIAAASLTLGGAEEVRATADANYVLGAASALRVDAMDQRAGVVDRDFVLNRRWGVAPAIAFGIGQTTSLTLSYLHQAQDDIPDYGIPFVAGRPAPVRRANDYGLPADDRFQTHVDVGALRFDRQLTADLSLSETARLGSYWFNSPMTAPHYDDSAVSPVPPPTAATPLDTVLIYRDRPSSAGIVRTAMSETDLTARFRTGALAHTLVAGLDIDQESADLVRYANQIGQIAPTPLLAPDPAEAYPGHQTAVTQRPATSTDTLGASLIDTVDIGDHWNLVAAVRVDRFHAMLSEPITGKHFDHTDTIASPRLALVYKPSPSTSLYVSYGTSFDPSAENLSLSASNQALPPEKDRTLEAGAKGVVLDGRLSLTAAVFTTQMTNARISDPTDPSLQSLSGNLRVNGVELGVQGHLTPHIEILAGYTHLDGRSYGLAGAGTSVGSLQNTAPNSANLWTVYEWGRDLKFGLGANSLDRRPADVSGTDVIPAYVTVDGMVSYRISRTLTAQLNAYNLAGVLYFTNSYDTSPIENHVLPGPGRTITLTLAAKF